MRVTCSFLLVGGLVLLLGSFAFGANVYVSQNKAGADTGADCADAHSSAWFNSNATGGNTYHLCGTFTGSAGSTMLTVPAGSAGNILTVVFETGAVLTAPYWATNGAIYVPSSSSYVLIDGGTTCGHTGDQSNTTCNGIIENSDNGSAANACDPVWPGYTYHQQSAGIFVAGGSSVSNIEVRNLHIRNIYRNNGSVNCSVDVAGQFTYGVNIGNNCSTCSVHNNEINATSVAIDAAYNTGTVSNQSFYANYTHDAHWHIVTGVNSGTPILSNLEYHNNEMTDWANWQCPSVSNYCTCGGGGCANLDTYHTDGFILIGTRAGGTMPVSVHNNFIHGDLGAGSATAGIFCTYGNTGSGTAAITGSIFNNLIVFTANHGAPIWLGDYTYNFLIANNTLSVPNDTNGWLVAASGTGLTFKNNIAIKSGNAFYNGGSVPTTVVFSSSDYNNYYDVNGHSWRAAAPEGFTFWSGQPSPYINWTKCPAQWTTPPYSACMDTHSLPDTNPNLTASYSLNAGSPAIGLGANLTSFCSGTAAALCRDRFGAARPVSGSWDAGAYQFANGPNPPTNLQAIPN